MLPSRSADAFSLGRPSASVRASSSSTAFLFALWLCNSRHSARQPQPLQTAMNDVERGHFLGDEQDFLALLDGRGDQVGDRLRLPRARGTLDDQMPAAADFLDHDRLRAIRVGDVNHVRGRDE